MQQIWRKLSLNTATSAVQHHVQEANCLCCGMSGMHTEQNCPSTLTLTFCRQVCGEAEGGAGAVVIPLLRVEQ